jgi:hypothetical protein
MTLRDDGKYDWDLDGLQRHANLVMQGLEAAIDNLDDSRVLSLILNDLGRKHARYQVQEDMFDVSFSTILHFILICLLIIKFCSNNSRYFSDVNF